MSKELDLSNLISVGGAGYKSLADDQLGLGIEYGGIFSGMLDDTDSTARNGKFYVKADGSLFLLDLFLGPQVNAQLGDKVRLYCGAGPLLMIGYVSADFKEGEIEQKYDINVNETSLASG